MEVGRCLLEVLVVVCGVLSVAGCGFGAFRPVRERRSDVLSAAMASGGLLAGSTKNGSVTVTAVEGDECSVTAEITAGAGSAEEAKELLDQVHVSLEPSETGLILKVDHPETSGKESVSVAYDIRLPRQSALSMETKNGTIRVTGVTGAVTVATKNGGVVAEDVGPNVDASTKNGRVTAVLGPEAASAPSVKLRTKNGAVSVTCPEGTSARVKASTKNGRIRFPDGVSVSKRGRGEAEAVLGAGEGSIALETKNGEVQIRQ
jgi:DUF4097 and DUF4098 domain-containing protein YvlB